MEKPVHVVTKTTEIITLDALDRKWAKDVLLKEVVWHDSCLSSQQNPVHVKQQELGQASVRQDKVKIKQEDCCQDQINLVNRNWIKQVN